MTLMQIALRPFAQDRWIPWLFVAGFGVVVAVNAVMVILAVGTFSGVESPRHFQDGLDYNRVLEESERQARIGWTVRVSVEGRELALRIVDAAGRPFSPAEIEMVLDRPAERSDPVILAAVATGPGVYRSNLDGLRHGQWALHVVVSQDGRRVDHRQRVLIR